MNYSMDDPNIRYMGRIDKSDPKAPTMYYAGSQMRIRFSGNGISVSFKNHTVWGNVSLGYIIDGREGKLPLDPQNNDKEITLKAAGNLGGGEHTIIVYKRLASNHFITFTGIDVENGEILPDDTKYDLKIEVYGDSVSAGEVCEAVDFVGLCDPENHGSAYDNSWHSYAMQTARALNAEIHNIAQGGIAVFDGTGYFHAPDFIGMETVYDKVCYFPEGGELTQWDFSEYTPDIVVFALGQNDKHNGKTDSDDVDITDPSTREHWKNGYKNIVRSLSEKYGSGTKFVLTTTVLNHDKAWDDAIEEIKDELNAENIKTYHNIFSRNGCATNGHPRIPEHDEMARELTAFIRQNVL